jgi:hypothetical protein
MTTLSEDKRMAFETSPRLILDDLTVRDLRVCLLAEDPAQEVFARAGFTIHYWRPAAPASMHNGVEIIFEHPASGLWFASRVEMGDNTDTPAGLLSLIESAIHLSWSDSTSTPASASLPALTRAVAVGASKYTGAKMGEPWTPGGLLLGCLRVLGATVPTSDVDAMRTLIALTDPHLLGQVERLAQWQDNVAIDRQANEEEALRVYIAAAESLWPSFTGAATAAHDLKTDLLLCHPREEWSVRAVEIVLDAVANQQAYVIRPLRASWELTANQPPTQKFSAQVLLDMAQVPAGMQVPALVNR